MQQNFRPLRTVITSNPSTEQEEALNVLLRADLDLTAPEKELLEYISNFHTTHDGLPSKDYLKEHFTRLARTTIVEYLELLESTPEIPFNDYKAKVRELSENKKDSLFKEALKETQIIHQMGKSVGKQTLKGRQDALDYFNQQSLNFSDVHESRQVGVLKEEAASAEALYYKRKNNPQLAYGITSGFYTLDEEIKGGKPGELHFVLGFTSSGKSLFSLNYAYNAACILGRNVVIVSLEMTKDQILEKLFAMHSAHEKFRDVHPPINEADFVHGKLTEEQEKFMFGQVIPDLKTNPDHGTLWIEYPGTDLTITGLKAKLAEIDRQIEIDMLIIDYPELMIPDKGQKYSDYGTSLNTIIKSVKQLALTYKNGKGLFILCPYQANRAGYERAVKNEGVYDLTSMSYANEAERACDVIYAVFKEPDSTNPEVVLSTLKNRRGKLVPPFKMSVLWQSGYMSVDVPQDEVNFDEYDWESF